MPRTTCCTSGAQAVQSEAMQSAQLQALSESSLAAKPQLSEKPRQGFSTKKTASHQGPSVCNFTVTLGLQAVVVENGVRKTYSARYYNPLTGRFLSRDPEDGNIRIPATLHKYLYTGGDPVNMVDPRGRESMFDQVLFNAVLIGTVAIQQFQELDPNSQAIVIAAVACVGNGIKSKYDLIGYVLQEATGFNLYGHDDPSPGDTPIDTACKDLAFAFPEL
jgi:RHS repeat-associated protein